MLKGGTRTTAYFATGRDWAKRNQSNLVRATVAGLKGIAACREGLRALHTCSAMLGACFTYFCRRCDATCSAANWRGISGLPWVPLGAALSVEPSSPVHKKVISIMTAALRNLDSVLLHCLHACRLAVTN